MDKYPHSSSYDADEVGEAMPQAGVEVSKGHETRSRVDTALGGTAVRASKAAGDSTTATSGHEQSTTARRKRDGSFISQSPARKVGDKTFITVPGPAYTITARGKKKK